MRRLFGRRGQSTAEYAIVIGLVIAAVIAMQTYVKRGMQGKIAKAVDNISGATGGTTLQYEPYYTKSDFTTTVDPHQIVEETTSGGGTEQYMGSDGEGVARTSTRTGYQGQRDTGNAD